MFIDFNSITLFFYEWWETLITIWVERPDRWAISLYENFMYWERCWVLFPMWYWCVFYNAQVSSEDRWDNFWSVWILFGDRRRKAEIERKFLEDKDKPDTDTNKMTDIKVEWSVKDNWKFTVLCVHGFYEWWYPTEIIEGEAVSSIELIFSLILRFYKWGSFYGQLFFWNCYYVWRGLVLPSCLFLLKFFYILFFLFPSTFFYIIFHPVSFLDFILDKLFYFFPRFKLLFFNTLDSYIGEGLYKLNKELKKGKNYDEFIFESAFFSFYDLFLVIKINFFTYYFKTRWFFFNGIRSLYLKLVYNPLNFLFNINDEIGFFWHLMSIVIYPLFHFSSMLYTISHYWKDINYRFNFEYKLIPEFVRFATWYLIYRWFCWFSPVFYALVGYGIEVIPQLVYHILLLKNTDYVCRPPFNPFMPFEYRLKWLEFRPYEYKYSDSYNRHTLTRRL